MINNATGKRGELTVGITSMLLSREVLQTLQIRPTIDIRKMFVEFIVSHFYDVRFFVVTIWLTESFYVCWISYLATGSGVALGLGDGTGETLLLLGLSECKDPVDW